MLECVANVAEGRDSVVIAALADACGAALLDVHFDADHNRSVFTLAADRHDDIASATRALARSVAAHVSIALHSGVHPWLGALDVVPFVALGAEGVGHHDAAVRAHEFASWWAEMFGVPVFLYGAADDAARDLPSVRREAFVTRPPDFGPRVPHPRLGATAVGVRPPLVAINCELATDNVAVARAIAMRVRGRDGGLPGVRALGFALPRAGRVQVSMNVTDLGRTSMEEACRAVRHEARASATHVARVELVGLVPAAELDRCSDDFLAWSGLTRAATIEERAARRSEPGA